MPILMLTARTQEGDRDARGWRWEPMTISKPFSAKELVARVKALLRRMVWAIAMSDVPMALLSIPTNVMPLATCWTYAAKNLTCWHS